MKYKICFKCQRELSLDNFYPHPQMSDGRLNKCKECTKIDVASNRLDKIEYYREYDKKRGNRQDREYLKKYRARYPNKYRAHNIVNNAVRNNKLFKELCKVCGKPNTHAHHDNYLKPLNVTWLCAAHHKQWHKENGEGKNP